MNPHNFTIPWNIKNNRIERAILDIGASINVNPYPNYAYLNIGHIKDISE